MSKIQTGLEDLCKRLGVEVMGLEFFHEPWIPEKLEISIDDVKVAFARHGLDEKYLPDLPSPKAAFGRVVRRAEKGVKGVRKFDISKGFQFNGKSLPDGSVYGFYPVSVVGDVSDIKSVDADLGKAISKVAFVEHPQVDVIFDGDQSDQRAVTLGPDIKAEWVRATQSLRKADISAMVRGFLNRWHVLSMLRGGKAYFVPGKFKDEVYALCEVLREIDPSGTCTVRVHPLPKCPEVVAPLAATARRTFEQELAEMKAKVESFGDTTRGKTMETVVDEARELKERLSMYADVCSVKAEDLNKSADKLTKQVYALLNAA